MADVNISVTQAVSITEFREAHALSEFSIFAWEDLIAISEQVSKTLVKHISEYETVSISEDLDFAETLGPEFSLLARIPVWELVAEFAHAFNTQDGLRQPSYSLQGYFGGILENKTPAYSIEASFVAPDVFASVAGIIPVRSLVSTFGGILTGNIPVHSLSATFLGNDTFSLDKKMPVWELAAAFTYPSSFTLSAKIPIWVVSITGDLTNDVLNLLVNIPGAFILSATMIEEGAFQLDEKTPVWRLSSTMYSPGFELDSNIPMWIIEDSIHAQLQYASRYTDYILRYNRP